jgi:flagellar basal-body rod modification protein FlgD
VDNGGVITVIPMLTSWQVTWDTIAEALQLDRNKISLRDGESLGISVIITAARSGSLTVHDAAGQLVRTFQRGAFAPGIASYTWDGRNEQGKQVAAGVYFVALRAKEIRSIKKVAVVR